MSSSPVADNFDDRPESKLRRTHGVADLAAWAAGDMDRAMSGGAQKSYTQACASRCSVRLGHKPVVGPNVTTSTVHVSSLAARLPAYGSLWRAAFDALERAEISQDEVERSNFGVKSSR